jgi:hypothetical protein
METKGKKTFEPYCVVCSTERKTSSSNAKFHFDYCTKCQKIANFTGENKTKPKEETEEADKSEFK